MAVGFASYEIARSGLTYNERGLNVTGHNVANVNTLGFSRQQAVAAGSFYIKNNAKYGYGQVGIGVDIQQIRQIRHKFLDNIYRFENAKVDYWNARYATFTEVENILGEPLNQGIQGLFNRFWDAWQELSKDPSSLTTRSLVRQLGESIAFEINDIASQFDRMQLELDAQFCEGVKQLGIMCEKVANLNKIIKSVQLAGEAPNDLMDARNLLLDQISSLVDCEIYERDDGMYDVIANGIYLVYRDGAKRLVTMQTPETGMFNKAFAVMREGSPPILEELVFGQCKLKGILESRGDTIYLPDVSASNGWFDPRSPLDGMIAGDVLFGRGSLTNGSPNTAADVVIIIDLQDAGGAYLEQLKINIDNYIEGLFKKGLDFNVKLVTTSGSTASLAGEYSKDAVDGFISDVLFLSSAGGVPNGNFGGPGGVLDILESGVAYRENANRYAVMFTGSGIDGSAAVTEANAEAYADRLKAIGMSLTVVTSNELQNSGSGPVASPFGWNVIAAATGGASVDYNEVVGNEWQARSFSEIMRDINDYINRSVNDRISMIPESNQILPDVRRRIGALVNIICRSVNELHRGGKTLEVPPKDGEDFFVPINPKYPLEPGNIKINPKFLEPNGLNFIAASESGATEDNVVARAIANLRNMPRSICTDVGKTTFDDYYRSAIYSISNRAAEALRYLNNQTTATASLNRMRHSIMDVSMDEELTHMMKFKFGYDAAARVLNVIDNMIETIVTRLGHVGR